MINGRTNRAGATNKIWNRRSLIFYLRLVFTPRYQNVGESYQNHKLSRGGYHSQPQHATPARQAHRGLNPTKEAVLLGFTRSNVCSLSSPPSSVSAPRLSGRQSPSSWDTLRVLLFLALQKSFFLRLSQRLTLRTRCYR